MSADFRPLLEQCALSFGATDEAPPDSGAVDVVMDTDENDFAVRTFDAVGIEDIAGDAVALLGFDWLELDTEAIREFATEQGVPPDELERELEDTPGEKMLVLTEIVPWRFVGGVELSSGQMELFR